MKEKTTHSCPELEAFFKDYFQPEEITERLDDILHLIIDYARLNQSSVDRM